MNYVPETKIMFSLNYYPPNGRYTVVKCVHFGFFFMSVYKAGLRDNFLPGIRILRTLSSVDQPIKVLTYT